MEAAASGAEKVEHAKKCSLFREFIMKLRLLKLICIENRGLFAQISLIQLNVVLCVSHVAQFPSKIDHEPLLQAEIATAADNW